MCKKAIFITMLLLFALVLSAAAADLAAGAKAYKSGDFKTALVVFQDLAAKGNAEAQNTLGLAYFEGKSVTKDLVQALAWIIKAESKGFADAKQNHTVLEREMTPEQIAAAYKLAGVSPQTK